MKEKIDKIKTSMAERLQDHSEFSAAFDELDERISSDESYPGRDLINDEIDKTTLDLSNEDILAGHLSDRWKTLGERLDEWEEEHPGITLMVGRIARALSVYGL